MFVSIFIDIVSLAGAFILEAAAVAIGVKIGLSWWEKEGVKNE